MTSINTLPRIDARGKTITTAIHFEVAEQLRSMDTGGRLELLTDEFAPIEADIVTWCGITGQELVDSTATSEGHHYLVEKRPERRLAKSLAMVISSDGLEELLSPLGFALAAALEGMDVSLYFQGPAVRVLTRGHRPKLRGWGRPFSRMAAAGMARAGHVAAQDKLRQLRSLGARIYVCGGSMPHFKVEPEDLVFDDLPLVEYFTFMAVMARADVTLYS